ncbi:MAG: HEAT repeat-containing protein 6 [Agathobacter sp.]|nr:HEAT repeat-containing protein 6 [Agathobacter sp.]
MKRVRLGLCIGDREYGDRFTGCLMNHYREQLELHIFTDVKALWEERGNLDAIVLGDEVDPVLLEGDSPPVIYLCDGEENLDVLEGKGVFFVDKYQEVNKIVDEILMQIGEEIKYGSCAGNLKKKMQIFGVYALAENEMQLPFAVTLASILSEKERVLLLDLQENSGLTQLLQEHSACGMEELLVMAESGKYSRSRMVSCIGHLDRADVVYPLGNTECLCEVKYTTYQKLFQILAQEMDYTTIVLNLGSRFVGFFELLGSCREIYLMKSRGGLGQWREKEFFAELKTRGEDRVADNLREIQLPVVTAPTVSCERLVEQWKWNEFGDSIRRMMPVG